MRRGVESRREIVVVLALALAGLTLAGLAAFVPWYDRPQAVVVDLRQPDLPYPPGLSAREAR
ncbi:hypothetical protein ACFFWC_06990 [Plantactinospora siamensis]|uniref:Uncharacterized protein n=1 Tax=Plantactinospora siamensis TaxID=555372 RepID=A0ABV6NXB9_9ACTN